MKDLQKVGFIDDADGSIEKSVEPFDAEEGIDKGIKKQIIRTNKLGTSLVESFESSTSGELPNLPISSDLTDAESQESFNQRLYSNYTCTYHCHRPKKKLLLNLDED